MKSVRPRSGVVTLFQDRSEVRPDASVALEVLHFLLGAVAGLDLSHGFKEDLSGSQHGKP